MNRELEKLLQAERKNRRYLAELRVVRKKWINGPDSIGPEAKAKLKLIDEEIASLLK